MMPSLHNYVTIDPGAFLAEPKWLEIIFNMCKMVCWFLSASTITLLRRLIFHNHLILISNCLIKPMGLHIFVLGGNFIFVNLLLWLTQRFWGLTPLPVIICNLFVIICNVMPNGRVYESWQGVNHRVLGILGEVLIIADSSGFWIFRYWTVNLAKIMKSMQPNFLKSYFFNSRV